MKHIENPYESQQPDQPSTNPIAALEVSESQETVTAEVSSVPGYDTSAVDAMAAELETEESTPLPPVVDPVEEPLASPSETTPHVLPPPVPPKKSYKGLVVMGVVFLMLLVGLAGGAWYYYENYPLKRDYTAAMQEYNQSVLDTADIEFLESVDGKNTTELSDEDLTKFVAELKSSYTNKEQFFKEFKPLRVNKDARVKAAHNQLEQKYKSLASDYIPLIEAAHQMNKSNIACAGGVDLRSLMTNARNGDEAQAAYLVHRKPCMDELKLLQGSSSDIVVEYADTQLSNLEQLGQKIKELRNAVTVTQAQNVGEAIQRINQSLTAASESIFAKSEKMLEDQKAIKPLVTELREALEQGKLNALI